MWSLKQYLLLILISDIPLALTEYLPGHQKSQQRLIYEPNEDDKPSKPLIFVALGDSFAAGPGAGGRVSWWDYFNTCRRSDHSYPAIVNDGSLLGYTHTFDFRACTGAKMKDVLKEADGGIKGSQLDSAALKADITTLSITGNDVGFFNILDACIYHFGGSGSLKACDEAIDVAMSTFNSDRFSHDLDSVIRGVLNNTIGAPSPQLFVTGYAQFFNSETPQCDNQTFCIWENPAKNHTCPNLTSKLRRRMNALTLGLNERIKEGVFRSKDNSANATITFIDYDSSFEGHRFCETDQEIPDYKNPDVWFYQTWGDAGEGSKPPDDADEPSYEDVDPDTCFEEANASGDWGRLAVCRMAIAKRENPDLEPEPGNGEVTSQDLGSWITPNQLARIFHPKIGGVSHIPHEKVHC